MKLTKILTAGAVLSMTAAIAFAGGEIIVEPGNGDNIAGVLLGLFMAYAIGSALMGGGASASTKGVDERMSKDKGKLLDRF